MVSTVALFWIWKNVIYFDYWCFLGNGCFENCLLVRFILDDWSFLAKILALLSYRGHAQEESLVFWVFYLEIWDFWSEEWWCSIFNWCYQFILSSKWASLLASFCIYRGSYINNWKQMNCVIFESSDVANLVLCCSRHFSQ